MKDGFIEPQFSNQYTIQWSKNGINMGSIIGKVINYDPENQKEFYINIEISDLDVSKTGFTIIAHTWKNNNRLKKLIPIIGITKYFINYPEYVKEGLIWHEVGHVHHKHVLRNKLTQDQLREERLNCIKKNDLLPMELEADIFAAKKVGKTKYIEILKYVKDHRPFENTNAYNEVGRQEYDIRIEKINKLVNN